MCPPPTQPYASAHALLRRYGLAAKKSWGQNFLTNERVFAAIVDATVASPDDWVIEVGAGIGTLTARLADRAARVVAVEREPDMLAVLRGELGTRDNVAIEAADAMTFDYAAVAAARGAPVALCGNLPYNISSQLLFAFDAARASLSRAVVMLQREVADRLTSSPGSKAYGAITVALAAHWTIAPVTRVSAGSFTPAPKVESAVVALTPLPPRALPDSFRDVVGAAFRQRRKTLRNALRASYAADAVDAALAAAGVEGGRRGETLSVDEFAAVAAGLPAGGA